MVVALQRTQRIKLKSDPRIQHTSADRLLKKLTPNTVDLLFLHPPNDIGLGSTDEREQSSSHDERVAALLPVAQMAIVAMKPGAQAIVAGGPDVLAAWHAVAMKAGFSLLGDLCAVSTGLPIRLRAVGTNAPSWYLALWRYVKPGHVRQDVLDYQRPNVVVDSPVPHIHRHHSSTCQLPLEFMTYIVTAFSRPGDLVVDPMCGSGTTLVAAELNDRQWIGGDKDGKWLLVVRGRIANVDVEYHGKLLQWPPDEKGVLYPIGGS